MSKPQGVALVGLGMVAPVFADAVRRLSPGVELRGVLASTVEHGNRFVEQQRALLPADCCVYRTIDEVAADDRVDFVLLATPPDARLDLIEVLADAGKPVLAEKPIERTLAAASAIVDRCESAGVPLGIVLQHRARPSVRTLLARIEAGELGRLAMAEVRVPWWRPQRYYDEPGRGTVARDGGGVLLTQAIHTLDLMLTLAGPVRAVTAMTATTALHDMETEDFATAGVEFASGAVGSILATTASFPGSAEQVTLHGDRASAVLVGEQVTIHAHDGRTDTTGPAPGEHAAGGSGENPIAFSSDLHMAMVHDFATALRNERPPLVTGRSALAVHRLIAAIERSAAAGQRIELP